MFSVQSQSNSEIKYEVDIVAYHCTCLSFPTICFCKHICAVQNHFPETAKAIPVSALITDKPLDDDCDDSNIVKIVDKPPPTSSNNLDLIDDMGAKLLELANQFRFHPPTALSETLHDLNAQLDNMLSYFRTTRHSILPPKKKIAPNQHSWTETAQVMGVAVKSKRKITHTDPYSGGERSGKKAKPDARSTVAQRTTPNTVCLIAPIAPVTPMP
jgi:hypothetical protein